MRILVAALISMSACGTAYAQVKPEFGVPSAPEPSMKGNVGGPNTAEAHGEMKTPEKMKKSHMMKKRYLQRTKKNMKMRC